MSLASLASLRGTWHAVYQLRGDPSFEADSPSVAQIVPMLGGRFVRIDYTWIERGVPQEGSLLIGQEADAPVTVIWIDSWHNGRRMMQCIGAPSPDGGVDVKGSYPTSPTTPDWGWRTHIGIEGHDWAMTMWNVSPDGEETLAVRAEYSRESAR